MTSRGLPWSGTQVWRSIRRIEAKDHQAGEGGLPVSINELRRHFVDADKAGCHSLRAIAAYLNSRGVLTKRGFEWYPSAVVRMKRHFQSRTLSGGLDIYG